MARLKLDLPERFSFSMELQVRITDVNYGRHLGNDTLLALLHEARAQYLSHHGYSEENIEGAGMIMTDAAVIYEGQAFHGDRLKIEVKAGDFSRIGCDFFYRVTRISDGKAIAKAKTGAAFFDYQKSRVLKIPEPFKVRVNQEEGTT
jgi:acyl-CoA thioester hydrolase